MLIAKICVCNQTLGFNKPRHGDIIREIVIRSYLVNMEKHMINIDIMTTFDISYLNWAGREKHIYRIVEPKLMDLFGSDPQFTL